MLKIDSNLTSLLSLTISARLTALAGGLDLLSRVPACNLICFGATNLKSYDGVITTEKMNVSNGGRWEYG